MNFILHHLCLYYIRLSCKSTEKIELLFCFLFFYADIPIKKDWPPDGSQPIFSVPKKLLSISIPVSYLLRWHQQVHRVPLSVLRAWQISL